MAEAEGPEDARLRAELAARRASDFKSFMMGLSVTMMVGLWLPMTIVIAPSVGLLLLAALPLLPPIMGIIAISNAAKALAHARRGERSAAEGRAVRATLAFVAAAMSGYFIYSFIVALGGMT